MKWKQSGASSEISGTTLPSLSLVMGISSENVVKYSTVKSSLLYLDS